MLIHGMIDDNVHMANTVQFVYELQKAQKPFRLMLYPEVAPRASPILSWSSICDRRCWVSCSST